MTPEERMMMAAQLRAAADRLLLPVAAITQLPPAVVQGFVEGATTGAVAAGKAPKKRKASAYNKAFADSYKRLKKKHPRTKHATLMKRAHAMAKKKVKK